eukprot:COSAG01_NODE_34453_length_547_cov_1.147321_1_plen_77_part_10
MCSVACHAFGNAQAAIVKFATMQLATIAGRDLRTLRITKSAVWRDELPTAAVDSRPITELTIHEEHHYQRPCIGDYH